MQLGARPITPPPTPDLAAALRVASATFGQRPAVTVQRPERRDEQGFASLAQWAAKTAHWLQIEHLLQPGGHVDLISPPGWSAVAVCLGAWWAGIGVHLGASDAEVTVVHDTLRDALPATAAEVVVTGDAVDGTPLDGSDAGGLEPYAIAVQAFPDQPPASRAGADTVALIVDGRPLTHAELLSRARDGDLGGTAGLDRSAPAELWVLALAVRPLVSGHPTVLLDGVGRAEVTGERVQVWLTP